MTRNIRGKPFLFSSVQIFWPWGTSSLALKKNWGQRKRPWLRAGAFILLLLIREIPPEFHYGGKLALWSENYLLAFEFIPRVLKQARQITKLYCAGRFVEKTEKARASCVQFAATDVKCKFSGNRTWFHKVICIVGVCSGDFILENELSTWRQEKASCQNNIFFRRPGFKSNCSRGKLSALSLQGLISSVWNFDSLYMQSVF